jgi:hypothetical protein
VNTSDGNDDELAAGEFSSWLTGMQAALRHERDSDVPCNGCTACCTSSQFIHITADEVETISHIPVELLFPAPRMPRGNFVLGYDERGHCPMLIDGACSIYEHRPRTCRTYDCRVFAAAGVELDDADKSEITARVRRWRFEYPAADDRSDHDGVRAAAALLRAHPDSQPEPRRPRNTTQLAVLAVETYERDAPSSLRGPTRAAPRRLEQP